MLKASQHLRDESSAGFSLAELLIVVVVLGILAAIAIPIYIHQKTKAHHAIAVQDGRALAREILFILADYADYGSTVGSISASGNTLTVTLGSNPTPAIPTAPTSAVNLSTGSSISGNLPRGAQDSPQFCLAVTNSDQSAVFDETGYRPGLSTCIAGVAS